MITIDDVKKLRDETNISISKCKEALEQTNGDFEKAKDILRQKGAIAAQKKSDRTLGGGVVQSYIHNTLKTGALVELLCETDFVARNEEFITLARDIALHATAMRPLYVHKKEIAEDLMEKITQELSVDIDTSKPKDIQDKILSGKLAVRLREVVLVEQPFVKDDSFTIQQKIEQATQKFGERIEIGRVVVFSI
ncbi:MAG: elongation factor Ts [Alphaproteobacteria bacterium]|nr:elongation factor Ts [Alphaproteobacteria bacterium]